MKTAKVPKISIFTKIFSAIIILLPFLYQYASPLSFLTLGDFLLAIFSIWGLFKLNLSRACSYVKPIIIFSLSFVVLTLFVSVFSSSYFQFYDALTIFLKILLYLAACAVCAQFFNLQYIKKFYLFMVTVFAVYLVIQVVYHNLTNDYLPNWLNHDWLYSWEKRTEDLNFYYTIFYNRYRPSSLFTEPGYYAMYVLPALLILLFEKRKFIASVLVYVTIILSTSGAGIIIGLFVFVLKGLSYAVYLKKGKIYFTDYSMLALFLLIIGLIYLFAFNTELLNRLFNSFNSRVTRSFLIFNEMDIFHKIFGVGMNNTVNFIDVYNISTQFDEWNLNFGASIVAVLVQYGIVGFVIFLACLLLLVYNCRKSKMSLLFILIYIIYAAFDEVIFNYRMGFLLAFGIYYIRLTNNAKVFDSEKLAIKELATVRH